MNQFESLQQQTKTSEIIFLENKYHIIAWYYVCVFCILYTVSESVYMKCEWHLYEVRIKARNQHCFKELLLLTVLVQMRGETQTFSRMIHQSSISQIFTELLHQACLRDKVFFLLWLKMTKTASNWIFTLNLQICNLWPLHNL